MFYAPATPTDLRPAALTGTTRWGRKRRPWTGEALAPAGGIRARIEDMARLTAALEPVEDFTGRVVRIGAAWITLERDGRVVTWHNGGTGGFRTWLGLDRAAGTAVVFLSATPRRGSGDAVAVIAGAVQREWVSSTCSAPLPGTL